ncbi:hypothetical protein [uncultured Cetobacterium sp.]|uniref:hypothetical protein n=1 Tax=uncultured Cetobacterium sp. TaxID=527638 RepID=UPI0025D40A1C|nr:hypothetical protein [uncultured Cetobacterium sp.]
MIISELTAEEVWPFLNDTSKWSIYYTNVKPEVYFYNGSGSNLFSEARFKFTTFEFLVEAEVTEYEPPKDEKPGRIAWHGWVEGDTDSRLDVHHAWLIENLSGGRVRILTQETQIGKPAKDMAVTKPNPMLNAHQEWIEGLANIALENR